MRRQHSHRFRPLQLLLCASCILTCVSAQTPLALPSTSSTPSHEAPWLLQLGRQALDTGLPSVAESYFLKVMALAGEDADLRQQAQLRLVAALIEQDKLNDAQRVLSEIEPPFRAEYLLLRAIFYFYRGDTVGLEQDIRAIRVADLAPEDIPWYYLLQGLLLKQQGMEAEAALAFDEAQRLSQSTVQLTRFEAFRISGDLIAGTVDESTIKQLEARTSENLGTRVGFGFARQYAVALHQLGRSNEALAVLQDQLKYLTAEERNEEAHLMLLIGLISGADSSRGQLALIDVLRRGRDVPLMQIALYQLLGAYRTNDVEASRFRQMLDELIAAEPFHRLRDELIMVRAWLYLQAGADDAAATDAETLIEQYAASAYREDALMLLAYLAWTADPPRYRSAADYLGRLRQELPVGRAHSRIGRMMADSYYLKGDYETAASLYAAIATESDQGGQSAAMRFQQVQALIATGQIDAALALADTVRESLLRTPTYFWQVEWNLALSLMQQGRMQAAQTRVNGLLERITPSLEPEMHVRLLWLRTALALRQAEGFLASQSATQTIEAAYALGESRNETRLTVTAHAMLQLAQAQFLIGENDQALETLLRLRERHPESAPAVLSYFEEARFLASQFKLAEAQLRLSELADLYPNDPNAPAALLEAALLSEQQGLDRNLEDALRLAESFLSRYPEHPLRFEVRLLQGNLARQLKQFTAALEVFESVAETYAQSDHPVYLAELYAANCLVALATREPRRLDQAVAKLEALSARTELPVEVRAEAAYSHGQIYQQLGNARRAMEIYWQATSSFLGSSEAASQLEARGRYWMSRTLIDLAELLQQQGRTREAVRTLELVALYQLPGERLARARIQFIKNQTRP